MKEIVYQRNYQRFPITLPSVFNKERPKKFFIYGDSFVDLSEYLFNSWTVKVCDYFNAAQYNWGISGASEQTIFHTFSKTLQEKRDFSIIFHTHPHRTDKFFGLYGLPMNHQFFNKWDSLITFPCLHIYWSTYNYKFSNGDTLHCNYPMLAPTDINQIHHLSFENNSLLADKIILKIEGLLNN